MKGPYRNIVGTIMKGYFVLISLAILISLNCLSNQAKAGGLRIVGDVLFETKPWQPPYYLPVALTMPLTIDFKLRHSPPSYLSEYVHRTGRDQLPISLGYFWALNNDEIVFINRQESEIYIINMLTGDYDIFNPRVGEYNRLAMIWVGPQDDIYAALSPSKGKGYSYYGPDYSNCRLFRFERYNGKYTYDDKSDFPEKTGYPRQVRISPVNNLFIQSGYSRLGFRGKNIVYNKYGQELGGTEADGESFAGEEFCISTYREGGYNLVKARYLKSEKFFLIEELKFFPYVFNFKYTFNDNLIMYCHHAVRTTFNLDTTMVVNIPTVLGEDISSGYHYTIDLDTLSHEGYKYYTISDISINYDGEIYALAVYFNEPGFITGDELIVMYRYRAVNDF